MVLSLPEVGPREKEQIWGMLGVRGLWDGQGVLTWRWQLIVVLKLVTWRGHTGCIKRGWGEASDSQGGGCPVDSDFKRITKGRGQWAGASAREERR